MAAKEPFWRQASTNLVKFVILLHQALDDYLRLFQVYEHLIDPVSSASGSRKGSDASSSPPLAWSWTNASPSSVTSSVPGPWHDTEDAHHTWTHWTTDAEDSLTVAKIPFRVETCKADERELERAARFDAVKR